MPLFSHRPAEPGNPPQLDLDQPSQVATATFALG
jgi:hypothetical protein